MTESRRVSGRRLLQAVGVWLLSAGALYGALAVAGHLLPRRLVHPYAADVNAAFVLVAYLLLFAALWVAFGGWAGLRQQLGFRYTSWVHLVLAPPVWLATFIVGGLLSVPFRRWLGPPKGNAEALVRAAHDPFAAVILVSTVVVVAPVCEELLFRGGLFGWLRWRSSVVFAAPVSAAVFAGAHLLPSGLVLLFVAGLSLALYYHVTGSTLNSVVIHACQNTVAVIAVFSGLTAR